VSATAIALRKPSATYGSCKASVLRTILGSFRVKRLGICATVAVIAWASRESEGWAAPPKEYPACTSKADDTNVQAARGAFEAGKAAFNETDYARAIVYWEDAFRRDCGAILMLKNLARAYEASAQYSEAAVALKTYLARAPEAEDKAELEEQLRTIEAKDQHPSAAPTVASKPTAPKTKAAPAYTPSTTEPVVAETPASNDSFNSDSDAKPVDASKLAAGLVAGAGLALGAASTLFWLDADADEEAATSQCPTRRDCPNNITEAGNEAIDRKQRWAIVGIGGGALLVGGVVWYLIAAQGDTSGSDVAAVSVDVPALVPAVGPGFAGLTWTNQF
jgi:hypothetical protein